MDPEEIKMDLENVDVKPVDLNVSEEFATIDELLSDTEDLEESEKPQVTNQNDAIKQDKDQVQKVPDKMCIFSSHKLDDILSKNTKLRGDFVVPKSAAIEGISDVTPDIEKLIHDTLDLNDPRLDGIKAGLGLKKKATDRMGSEKASNSKYASSKAKTLAEKRRKLKEDMMKYGVAAIEKMYPRQAKQDSPKKKNLKLRQTHYKLKPAPLDMQCEEVDARQIIRPLSHAKYIHQPAYDQVIYIRRRQGLVPLASLCKDSKTIMSSNVRLLAGRNVRLGRPGCYVRDNGRLLAVGGTRNKEKKSLSIVKVPSFEKTEKKMTLFEIDDEFANFAVSAVIKVPSVRVDIRDIKKMDRIKTEEPKIEIREENLLDRMIRKLSFDAELHKEEIKLDEEKEVEKKNSEDNVNGDVDHNKDVKEEIDENKDSTSVNENGSQLSEIELGVKIELSSKDVVLDNESQEQSKPKSSQEKKKNMELLLDTRIDEDNKDNANITIKEEDNIKTEIKIEADSLNHKMVIENLWNDTPKFASPEELNLDECPPLRGYSEGSIKSIKMNHVLNFEGYSGYDICDVERCICKEEELKESQKDEVNSPTTEFGTPCTGGPSGGDTPMEGKMRPRKIAKDLKRVKRALKTLGVKIIEYDDQDDDDNSCSKEFCRLGCVCETLRTRPTPPTHCGKEECMFQCNCSKEALKYSSSRRVNISAAVGARIQEDSQRNMAAEERKFTNTVIVTGNKDTVMLGGRGTRRERKVPQRYLNPNTLMLDSTGKDYVDKDQDDSNSDDDYDDEEDDERNNLEYEMRDSKLNFCTVIIPKIDLPISTQVWCMYHCQYNCPCYKFKNPLEWAVDKSTSRNVAKRSTGANFLGKKRKSTSSENKVSKKKTIKRSTVESKTESENKNDPDIVIEAEIEGKSDLIQDSFESNPDIEMDDGEMDIEDPEYTPTTIIEPEVLKKDRFRVEKGQCARTAGLVIKQSNKTIMPYEPGKNKNKVDDSMKAHNENNAITIQDELTDFGQIVSVESLKDQQSNSDVSTTLNTELAPKDSMQYVRWDILKKKFIAKEIDFWFHVRPGKGNNRLFMSKGNTQPYLATAINVRNLQGGADSLPSLIEECLAKPNMTRDQHRYAILESNGIVWLFKGLLSNKKGLPSSSQENLTLTTDCKEKSLPTAKVPTVKPTNSATRVKVRDGSIKISLQEPIQKLPIGQSLITIIEGQRAVMQVKLPPTKSNQYWSLISVGGAGQSSIQCPDSTLVLKCAILQQAATLSSATSTTVRIPIPVGEQDPSFGVYAVPGLKTHVFVGPFASTIEVIEDDDDDDIVCLDDEDESMNTKKSVGPDETTQKKVEPSQADDDDEISIIEPKEEKVNNEELEKRKKRRLLAHNTRMIGQVPMLVSSTPANDDDVDIVGVVNGKSKSPKEERTLSNRLKTQNVITAIKNPLPYASMPMSRFGKVVLRSDQATEHKGKVVKIKTELGENVEVFLENCGKVTFTHPTFQDHNVICSSLDTAKQWVKENRTEKSMACDEDEVEKETKEIASVEPEKSKEVDHVEEVKEYPPILQRIKTPALLAGNSNKKVALFLQTKQEKDLTQLFYELGQTAYNNCFQRNMSRNRILIKAKEEIGSLDSEGKQMEVEKVELLEKRKTLFDTFTRSLQGLPINKKKSAVLELKALLKKDKDDVKNPEKLNDTKTEQVPSTMAATPASARTALTAQTGPVTPTAALLAPAPAKVVGSLSPYTDVTGLKTVKPDGSIIRPMNAFMLWAKDKRSTLMAQGMTGPVVSQILSENWKSMSEEEKSNYYKESEHLKALHKIQHPDYKYKPKTHQSVSKLPSTITSENATTMVHHPRQAHSLQLQSNQERSFQPQSHQERSIQLQSHQERSDQLQSHQERSDQLQSHQERSDQLQSHQERSLQQELQRASTQTSTNAGRPIRPAPLLIPLAKLSSSQMPSTQAFQKSSQIGGQSFEPSEWMQLEEVQGSSGISDQLEDDEKVQLLTDSSLNSQLKDDQQFGLRLVTEQQNIVIAEDDQQRIMTAQDDQQEVVEERDNEEQTVLSSDGERVVVTIDSQQRVVIQDDDHQKDMMGVVIQNDDGQTIRDDVVMMEEDGMVGDTQQQGVVIEDYVQQEVIMEDDEQEEEEVVLEEESQQRVLVQQQFLFQLDSSQLDHLDDQIDY